jgi:hypothetical protein
MRSRNRWPGRRNGRRVNKPNRRQALALLAAAPGGCTDSLMFANGFTAEVLVELVRDGFATATLELTVIGERTLIEVARMRITDAGRQALEKAIG